LAEPSVSPPHPVIFVKGRLVRYGFNILLWSVIFW